MRNRDGEKPFTTLCSVYKILQFSEPNCAWTLTSNSCSRGLKTCEAERCKSPKDIVLYIGTLFFLNSALKAGLYQPPWESVLCNELFSLWSPSKQRKEIIFHNTSPRKMTLRHYRVFLPSRSGQFCPFTHFAHYYTAFEHSPFEMRDNLHVSAVEMKVEQRSG